MKAIIYARTSTDNDTQKASIPEQEYACTEYAKNEGLEIVNTYQDKASGKDLKREGLQTALGALALGDAEILLVKDQSRLLRETGDLRKLEVLAYTQGWKIHTVEGVLDFGDPDAKLLITIKTALDTREREITKKKIKAAIAGKMARGEKLGGTRPFGYAVEVRDGKKILVEDKRETKAIKLIQSLRDNEMTLAAICKELRRRKIKNVSGNTKWNAMSVSRILKREKA